MNNQANTATQKAAQIPNAPTQYVVSESTAMFLDLLKGYRSLYVDIVNALEKFYGTSQADILFNKDFHPIMNSLQNAIFEYLNYSIQENTGNTI